MKDSHEIINQIIVHHRVPILSLCQWRDIILISRANSVLPRVAYIALNYSSAEIPPEVKTHLQAARRHETLFHNQVRFETETVRQLVAKITDTKLVILKGAGYVLSENKAANGRVFSDIDILLPKNEVEKVEQCLMMFGWLSQSEDDYDQHYYREWAHEIPPLRHFKRGAVLDVHHNIVPPVSGRAPNANILFSSTVTLPSGIEVLQPSAMFLHSAVHLFFGEEFHHGYRDLTDLAYLLEEFVDDKNEMAHLGRLAKQMGFSFEVFLAFRYLEKLLNVNIELDLKALLPQVKLSKLQLVYCDFVFTRVLALNHKLIPSNFRNFATNLAFVRGHLLKMPLRILLKHSAKKMSRYMTELLVGNIDKKNRSKDDLS